MYFNPVSAGYLTTDGTGASLIDAMMTADDEDAIIDWLTERLSIDPIAAAARYVAFAEKLKSRGLLEQTDRAGDELPIPYYGFIEITRECPSMCRICAIATGRGSTEVLTPDEIKHVIDQFKGIGIRFVALTGGDPLMREDLIPILEHIRRGDLTAGFSTSLLNLTERTAHSLGALDAKVQVSLDGSSPEVNDYNRGRGSFEKAMEGIRILNRHRIEFRIAFCIMKHNLRDIPDMVRLAEDLGAREIAFRKIKLLGRALELRDEVYPSPEDMAWAYGTLYREAYGRSRDSMKINAKYNEVFFKGRGPEFDRPPCGAGRNIIHVTYRGDVVPCSLFTEDQFVQGNVRSQSVAEIWETSELLSFFRKTTVDDIPECKDCAYKYLCGGGCRAEAYFLDGDLLGRCCDCDDLVTYYDHFLGSTARALERVVV
jgi:radical SAM protein with 4Fe4S-binding SPASM domain